MENAVDWPMQKYAKNIVNRWPRQKWQKNELENRGGGKIPVPQNKSAFSTKHSWSRSLKKVADYLPHSPRKKVKIVQSLESKHQTWIKKHENSGRPRKELSDEKKNWMIDFLSQSDMTYTNPPLGQCLSRESGWWAEVLAPAVLVVPLEGFTGYSQW